MNVVKTIKGVFLKNVSDKENIVERLLGEGSITAGEAVTLLREKFEINIASADIDISSGARVIGGDDNSIDNRL